MLSKFGSPLGPHIRVRTRFSPCDDLRRDHVAKLPKNLNLTPNPQHKKKGKQDAAVPTTDRRPKGFHGAVAWSCLRIGCALGAVVMSYVVTLGFRVGTVQV